MKKNVTKRCSLFRMIALPLAALILPFGTEADDRNNGHSRLVEQLTQFDGGCPPNQCEDVQFSIHRATVCLNGPNAGIDRYSVSMVREFSGHLSGGSSTLVRADDGLAFNLTTTSLRPNSPHTIWWVAFNPDNPCISNEDPCSCSAEALRPGADSVFYATGAMSDRLGSVSFAGNVEYGEVPAGIDQIPFGGLFGVGIQPGAEIHFVVRAHGPALDGGGHRDQDHD